MMQSKTNMCLISIKNLTAAQMAKKALTREGIYTTIVSVDPTLTKSGCSYGLSFNCAEGDAVRRVLNRAQINYGELGVKR